MQDEQFTGLACTVCGRRQYVRMMLIAGADIDDVAVLLSCFDNVMPSFSSFQKHPIHVFLSMK